MLLYKYHFQIIVNYKPTYADISVYIYEVYMVSYVDYLEVALEENMESISLETGKFRFYLMLLPLVGMIFHCYLPEHIHIHLPVHLHA